MFFQSVRKPKAKAILNVNKTAVFNSNITTMLRKVFSTILVCLFSVPAYTQSIDEKIGYAMNMSDWFTLDSLYSNTPKDSIHPFLEIYSRCLLGNRLNRPDVSIPAFQELFNTQSAYLDLNNLISSTFMFGMDLSRIGQNDKAVEIMRSVLDASKQYLDSITISNFVSQANRYEALSAYKPYQIQFDNENIGHIPFTIIPVGPKEKESVLMHLNDSYINGCVADITFDTGAGTNLISPEMADKYNLIPLEKTRVSVMGVREKEGYIAIAKKIKLGNITVCDVPFTVISLSSNNSEADQYIDAFNIVVGSDLMLRLKDLTIDFVNHQITIPSVAPVRSNAVANMCFSPTMNLLTKGYVLGTPMMMCLDSGDAAFGSASEYFYDSNKDYIEQNGRQDTIRTAGVGGFQIEDCYYIPNIPITIAGTTVTPSEFVVKTQKSSNNGDYDARIGLRTMMLFGKIHFNMVDFTISAQLPSLSAIVAPKYSTVQPIKVTVNKPSSLQTIGFVGMCIANGLLNHNAPSAPDL